MPKLYDPADNNMNSRLSVSQTVFGNLPDQNDNAEGSEGSEGSTRQLTTIISTEISAVLGDPGSNGLRNTNALPWLYQDFDLYPRDPDFPTILLLKKPGSTPSEALAVGFFVDVTNVGQPTRQAVLINRTLYPILEDMRSGRLVVLLPTADGGTTKIDFVTQAMAQIGDNNFVWICARVMQCINDEQSQNVLKSVLSVLSYSE